MGQAINENAGEEAETHQCAEIAYRKIPVQKRRDGQEKTTTGSKGLNRSAARTNTTPPTVSGSARELTNKPKHQKKKTKRVPAKSE